MNAQSPGGVSRQAAPAGRVGISAPALLCNDGIAVESKSHFRRPAIHGVEELDQAAHAGLLIIPPAHVAAVFAEQEAAVLHWLGQRFRAGGETRSGLRAPACSCLLRVDEKLYEISSKLKSEALRAALHSTNLRQQEVTKSSTEPQRY